MLARVQSEECRSRTPGACGNVNHKHMLRVKQECFVGWDGGGDNQLQLQ